MAVIMVVATSKTTPSTTNNSLATSNSVAAITTRVASHSRSMEAIATHMHTSIHPVAAMAVTKETIWTTNLCKVNLKSQQLRKCK